MNQTIIKISASPDEATKLKRQAKALGLCRSDYILALIEARQVFPDLSCAALASKRKIDRLVDQRHPLPLNGNN